MDRYITTEDKKFFKQIMINVPTICNDIINSHEFLKRSSSKDVRGNIRRCVIQTVFQNEFIRPNARIKSVSRRLGTGRSNRDYTFLQVGNTLVSICKTDKKGKLPNKAFYKTELSKNNFGILDNAQISLEETKNEIISEYLNNYAILIYDFIDEDNSIKFAQIVYPNTSYNGIIESIDIDLTEYDKDESSSPILDNDSIKQKVQETFKLS